MNKKVSFLLSILVVFAMMTAVLSSCNGGTEPQKSTETSGTTTPETTVEQSSETESESQGEETTEPSKENSEADSGATTGAASLSDWNGKWNNIEAYANEADLEKFYKEGAEANGIAVEELKKTMAEKRHCDFNAMVVEDTKVKFLSERVAADGTVAGDVIDEDEYTFSESVKVEHGGHDVEWSVFKATKPDAKFPLLFLMPPHGEEVMLHFHLRYGSDVEEIKNQEVWPTFVQNDISLEKIGNGIVKAASYYASKEEGKEHEHEHEHEHEDGEDAAANAEAVHEDDVSMADWNGSWNNIAIYFDRPEQEKAFKDLADREKVSVEEAKKGLLERRACEFNGLVIDGDKVKFLDGFEAEGGQPVSEEEYAYVESYKVKHGAQELMWHVFKAKNEEAKYPVLLMMPIHGEEELTHFHMRYGKDVKEMLGLKVYPTFIKPSTTTEQLYDEITE